MTQASSEVTRVVVRDVGKAFGATRALAGADLEVRAGEVHTVLGENGSGKSTLVKILSGVHRPDSGDLMINGRAARALRSPAGARALGVATVFQEVLTIPGRTILENIWIGPNRTGLGHAEQRSKAATLLPRLLGQPVDLDAPIESLSLSGRQATCIARSLVHNPALLVLDESTSALDVATRDRLFELVRELTAQGSSTLFISHRMDEVFEISDVITVLRSGRTVAARLPAAQTTSAELVLLMSGVDVAAERHASRAGGTAVLRVDGTRISPSSAPTTLALHAGELIGLAGLEGQGQETFLKALRGLAPTGGGTVTRLIGGAEKRVTDPATARDVGIAYIPRERRREGIFEQLAVSENFGLPTLGEDATCGLVRGRRTVGRLMRLAKPLSLKMGHHRDLITTLSGGNQQKVLIARALADAPQVLLLNDPTRGIDHNAKHDVYSVLDELCASGVAMVVLSSEVDELVHIADRVLVFKDQSVSADLSGDDITRANIVAAYFDAAPTASESSPSTTTTTDTEAADVDHADPRA